MLPILSTIEFSKILPLSEKTIEKIIFREGINKFLAENGSGKTTLTDLIEHSLVRDAHAFAWSVFSKKRVDRDAYVKSEWIFGGEKCLIFHEFTDAGARTRVSSAKFANKAHTRDMYSDFLFSKTNLLLEQVQKLFEGVYYKRENDLNLLGTPGEENLMDFFELLNKAIRMDTPTTIKLRNQIGETKRQIDIRKNKKRQLEVQLEKMEIIFASAETSADAVDKIGSRKGELQRDTDKLKKELKGYWADLDKLEKKDEEIFDKLDSDQEHLLKIRTKYDETRAKSYSLQLALEKLNRELNGFEKLGSINYQEVKTDWANKQNCELCGSMVYDNWEERISDGCPVCGTGWKQIPTKVKDSVTKKKIESESRDIQKEIDKKSHELRAIEEELKNQKSKENVITKNLKDLRNELTINNSKKREIQKKVDDINEKIQRIGVELGGISAQERMVNQDESIALLKVNLERLGNEIEKYNIQLERLEQDLPEQKELQHILNNFTRTTKEIFGYSMLADTDTRIITITRDDSSRDFAAMSWSERYFIDVVFRIAIFHFLIDHNIIPRGLLILDSPEAALDPDRLDLLAKIINNHKDKVDFIVATRVGSFYKNLDGYPLEIKKQTQTSLFDFIN
jgi:DNA repair exonuclease SbcCD ATPase subunit